VAMLPALAASPPTIEAVTLFFWLLSSSETLHQNFSPSKSEVKLLTSLFFPDNIIHARVSRNSHSPPSSKTLYQTKWNLVCGLVGNSFIVDRSLQQHLHNSRLITLIITVWESCSSCVCVCVFFFLWERST